LTRKRLVVAAVVVDSLVAPVRVLAARRSVPPTLAGRWEFPGGKVELGEAPVSALSRELAEELAIEVVVGDELPGPDGGCWPISDRLRMRTWWAEISAGRLRVGSAHDEVRWLLPAELSALPWLPADLAVVAAVRRELGA